MMHSLRRAGLAVAALSLSAVVADAQGKSPASGPVGAWSPFVAGGLAVPIGKLADGASLGFYLNGGAEYRFNADFGVRPELDFTYYTGKNGLSSLTSFGFGASALWHWAHEGTGFHPYGLFRLGMNAGSATATGGGSASSTDVGFAPGVGGNWTCGSKSCFVEGKFYIVNSNPSANALIFSFGLNF